MMHHKNLALLLLLLAVTGSPLFAQQDPINTLVAAKLDTLASHIQQGNIDEALDLFVDSGGGHFYGRMYPASDSLNVVFNKIHTDYNGIELKNQVAVRAGKGISSRGMMYLSNQDGEQIREPFYMLLRNVDDSWKLNGWIIMKSPIDKPQPVQYQKKMIYDAGSGVYLSNKFAGARLNGVVRNNDSLLTVLIAPENKPINHSPWYAFKIWSEEPQQIQVKLTYDEGPYPYHRYDPKLSADGENWVPIDSTDFNLHNEVRIVSESESRPDRHTSATMNLSIGPDTLWVAAQEVMTYADDQRWVKKLAKREFVEHETLGQSVEGRNIPVVRIGDGSSDEIVLLMSRQHPPEVTGYKAMKHFVGELLADTEQAEKFRNRYTTYLFPMMNPDGVDNGHWRHNMGGVDLNRNWLAFNQPEVTLVRDYVEELVGQKELSPVLFIDFHSTMSDLYYTIDNDKQSLMPGFANELLQHNANAFSDYEPVIRSGPGVTNPTNQYYYFFNKYGTESIVYEVGDNTPRSFVREKAIVTARKMMELLNNR